MSSINSSDFSSSISQYNTKRQHIIKGKDRYKPLISKVYAGICGSTHNAMNLDNFENAVTTLHLFSYFIFLFNFFYIFL